MSDPEEQEETTTRGPNCDELNENGLNAAQQAFWDAIKDTPVLIQPDPYMNLTREFWLGQAES